MATLPVAGGRIVPTGARAWLASRSGGARLHAGVDLGRHGDAVLAPEAGRVVLVISASRPRDAQRRSTPTGWAGYGPRAVLLHGDSGAFHLLAHVDNVLVSPDDIVAEGQHVADVSVLGHLHWEVRAVRVPPLRAATVEISADPAAWLRGEWSPYSGQVAPPTPESTRRTPRQFRPGYRGPAPHPFPQPTPRVRGGEAPHG